MSVQLLILGLALMQSQSVPAAASCSVMPSSIIGRSPGGIAQVSNLSLNRIEASVSRRTRPTSGVLEGLRAAVTVYQVGESGGSRVVPATINVSGGGGDQEGFEKP